MQPWLDKSSSSSSSGGVTSSLHYDKVLSHLQGNQATSSSSSQSGFRTASANNNNSRSLYYDGNNMETSPPQDQHYSYSSFQQNQPFTHSLEINAPYESPLDGSEVMGFLNSTEYSDHLYQDDLKPDSISYISYRHQADTQQGLSEKEKLQHHWTSELLGSEDIVEYLQNADYTEDIYGLPVIGQWIKEAKMEAMQIKDDGDTKKTAIARLDMIRQHLVQKAFGDPELAAKNVMGMNSNDWSSTFLDSSF